MDTRQRRLVRFIAELASIPLPTESMTVEQARQFNAELDRDYRREVEADHLNILEAMRRRTLKKSGLDAIPDRELTLMYAEFLTVSSLAAESVGIVSRPAPDQPRKDRIVIDVRSAMLVDEVLPRLHAKVRPCLRALFEGRSLSTEDLYQDEGGSPLWPYTMLSLRAGRLHERPVHDGTEENILIEVLATLRMVPFPFGRCPVCYKFFARVRRQRYCSPVCTAQGVEAARKGTRREYMRDLMRRRRARERTQLKKKGQ